jgi:hypothetical protein
MELAINIDLFVCVRASRVGSAGVFGQGAQSSAGIARAPFRLGRLPPPQRGPAGAASRPPLVSRKRRYIQPDPRRPPP